MKLPDDFDIDSLPVIGEGAAQTPQAQSSPSATGSQSPQQPSADFDLDSLPELPRIPTEEEKAAQFEEWKRRRDAAQAAVPEERRPSERGVLGDVARGMFTAEGIREAADNSLTAKPYAYMNDLANSIVSGFLGGGAKISEAAGRIIGDNAVGRALVNDAQAGQDMLERNLPTNALDTSGGGVVNKALDVGKGVAHVTGEFAPAAIPGIGQAYAATTVSAGSVNRYGQVKEAAKASGYSDAQAEAWATGAGALDALQNILLMKGFRGIWGGGQKAAADAAKQSLVKKLMVDTVKTGGIMSGGGMAQDVVNQNVGIDQKGQVGDVRPYDWKRTAEVGVDQFLEGGMFHLLNTAAHAMPKALAWESAPRTMSARLAREALDTPEGRALVMSNNPEAAKKILEARKNGKDVSRRMLEELGIPSEVAPSKGDRNALADSVAEDYRTWKDWQKTLPDKQQSAALDAEIAGVGAEGDAAAAIRQRVLEEVNRPRPPEKDGGEPRPADGPDALNDPKRRAELVMNAAREIVGDKGDIGRQIEAGKNAEARAENVAAEPPSAEPPKNAPTIAPREEGTTTPPNGAEPPQGVETPLSAAPAAKPKIEASPSPDAQAGAKTVVANKEGKPIPVYHFTKSEVPFGTFDRSKAGPGMYGHSFYFFTNRKMAENWENPDGEKRNVGEYSLDIKRPYVDSNYGYEPAGGLNTGAMKRATDAEYSAVVKRLEEMGYRINPEYSYGGKVPYRYENGKEVLNNHGLAFLANALEHKSEKGEYGWKHSEAVRKALESLGYDGVVGELSGYTQIAAFNPEQIKSTKQEPPKPATPTSEPPKTATSVKEPPPELKKPFGTGDSSHGQGKYSRKNYDSDSANTGATGAATWHWQNGERVYSLPVDFSQTRPGGPVVLDKTDSAYERIKELLNGRQLVMTKSGKIQFKGEFKGAVPKELRELLGRELKIGKNPDAPSKDDLYGVNKGQFGEETRTTWEEVERAVAADRENYHNWQKRMQRADRRASEEKKLEKKVKSGKATQNELDILRHRNMMEDYLDQGGKETDADYKAMERDLEVLQESGTYDYEGLSKAKDAADRFRDAEWENAIGDIESGEGDFSPSDQYVKPFTRENLQGAKKGDIIHFDHDEVKYELDRYDPETGVMDVYRSDENGVKRRFKVSRNGVEEIRNDGKGQKGVVQDNAGDAGGGGRPAPGAAGGEARGEEGAGGAGDEFDILKAIGNPNYITEWNRRHGVKGATDAEIRAGLRKQIVDAAQSTYDKYRNSVLKNSDAVGDSDFLRVVRDAENVEDFVKGVKGLIEEHRAVRDDWAGRSYKTSRKRVEVADRSDAFTMAEGETNRLSTDYINERRRRNRVEGEEREMAMLRESLENVLGKQALEELETKYLPEKPADLTLESLTPAEQRAERERIAQQQQTAAQKAEMEERRTATLKGGTGDLGQQTLDIEGAEGEQDLFNRREARNPEQEIAERLDLRRLEPKRRSDPKVLEWAKKNRRTITDGKVTPDALRAYDEAMTEAAAKVVNKRWFPDMKIVTHKYGETIKRGQHVLDRLVDDEGIIKAFENEDGTVTVYRAVQVNEKGEVRPPQSTRVQESDGKIVDRPAEGYVDKDGNIRSASGGAVVIKAEERPDLAHRVKNRDGTWKKVTERDVKDGRYPPEMLGADKWFFDLKKAKGTGSTDNVVYDPYMHSSDTPLNDQFTSAWKRPDWRIAVSRILKSDLESGYRADKAGLSVGAHEWKGGAVDNQLPKNMKRKVFLTQHLKMERILPEAEAAKILKEKWGEMGLKLEIPDSRVSPAMREALIKEGFNVVKTGDVQYLRDTAGRALGWFDPKSKEVHLLPGADPQTVAHEIMWHGTRDYFATRAAKGDALAQKVLDKMKDVELHAPQDIKDIVNRLYARGGVPVDRDTLMNEYGAWFTMKRGGYALEKAMQKAENRNWFARGLAAVKDMYKNFLIRHGKNRVDLSQIDTMTRDQFVDFLTENFAGGKTLGNIGEPQQRAVSTKETWPGRFRRRIYDQNAAIRDVQRDIERTKGVKIAEADNVEMANALKYGLKEAANIEIDGKIHDFGKTLHEAGIHIADVEYYAALKAAAGRDAKIDARNIAKLEADMKAAGATPDEIAAAVANYRSTNGSHIDPREARRMVAEIENGPDAAKYKEALKKLREIRDETLQVQVDAGLVSKESADQWRAEEPDYVPFKNEYDPETGEWNGRGTSRDYSRPEHRMAKGRQSAAGDIAAHIFMDHQAAKHRAIENAVRQKLAKLVRANPELGTVEKLRKDAYNVEGNDPNVVTFKENGDSYAIRLEGTRGAAIANAFTQRNQLNMKWADAGFSVFGKNVSFRNFAHMSAGMATRYSLTFSLRNTLKDNIELANIVYSERGFVAGSKFMKDYVANRWKMKGALARYVTTGKIDTSTAEGAILDRYIKAGGLIAGGVRAEAFSGLKERLDPSAIEKEVKRGASKAKSAAKYVFNSIGYLNEYAEMATRVGVFATEVKGGKSDAEAALFSRRATVDFNRHGDWTPAFNMFRLFSNSTLGATARAAAAFGKSKYGKRAALLMFANGLTQALVNYYVNRDEDKEREARGEATGKDMGEYDRRTSLFYFRSGDKVYKVAQHESPFSLFKYAGDCVGRWLCGELKGADVAKNLGVSTAEIAYNFLPMGQINLEASEGGHDNDLKSAIISGICPSVVQPIAELFADIDFKGDSIYRRKFDKYTPDSANGKKHTAEWAKSGAAWLNEASGGNEGRAGKWDIAPETLQHLAEGYGKNMLRDVSTFVSLGQAIVNWDFSGLDPRNTPIKRDFVRPIDGNTRRYYEQMDNYRADRHELLKMATQWTPEERKAYVEKHPWARNPEVNKAIQKIGELQKYEDGFVKNGRGWVKRKAPPTEEQKAKWKAARLRYQARFLEYAEKHGGEH